LIQDAGGRSAVSVGNDGSVTAAGWRCQWVSISEVVRGVGDCSLTEGLDAGRSQPQPELPRRFTTSAAHTAR